VQAALSLHLPAGTEVLVYGSRARGTRIWRGSDLDLMIKSDAAPSYDVMEALAEELSESLLPYMVDLHDWHRTSPEFLARITPDFCPLAWELTPAQS